jgi:hypothetical protein
LRNISNNTGVSSRVRIGLISAGAVISVTLVLIAVLTYFRCRRKMVGEAKGPFQKPPNLDGTEESGGISSSFRERMRMSHDGGYLECSGAGIDEGRLDDDFSRRFSERLESDNRDLGIRCSGVDMAEGRSGYYGLSDDYDLSDDSDLSDDHDSSARFTERLELNVGDLSPAWSVPGMDESMSYGNRSGGFPELLGLDDGGLGRRLEAGMANGRSDDYDFSERFSERRELPKTEDYIRTSPGVSMIQLRSISSTLITFANAIWPALPKLGSKGAG